MSDIILKKTRFVQRFISLAVKVLFAGIFFLSSSQQVVSQTTSQGSYLTIDQVTCQLENKYPIHFTSWLGLAPGQHLSGKKRYNKRKQGRPKAGQIFREIAQSLINSKNIALGAFGRKLRAKKGPAKAIKAMAGKLAELYWKVMVNGIEYAESGIKNYEEMLLLKKRKTLEKLARELNYQISIIQPVT